MRGAMLEELGAMAQQRPQGHAVRLRTKRGGQQPVAMEGLDPLTVQHITLASWDMLERLGADQTTLEATGFQGLEQRHPIDAGGCHRDRLDTAVDEPVRQGLEISGLGAKSTDDLLIVTVGDAGHDCMRTTIHTSGVEVDRAHALEGTSFAMGRSGTIASAQLAHGGLLLQNERDGVRSRSIT